MCGRSLPAAFPSLIPDECRWGDRGCRKAPFPEKPLKKTLEQIFAATAPGLESVCAAEAESLGMKEIRIYGGGVEFSGGLQEVYRANLWMRTAGRILVRVGAFGCRDFPELFRRSVRLPWGKFIRPGTAVKIQAVCRRSRLMHTGRIQETIAEAIERALGASPVEGPEQIVFVRLEDDRCCVSVDSSGELLHRRGYRLRSGPAPMRETMAAGVLRLLDWSGNIPLLDPLCGSGTLVVEGALLASNLPPGRDRAFSFMRWPGSRPGLWEALLQEAGQIRRDEVPLIRGSDSDEQVLSVARQNADRAGILTRIELLRADLVSLVPPASEGLLVCNPPYGGRLGSGEDLRPFFRTLGEVCRRFHGWQVSFLSPDESLSRAAGLPLRTVARLSNGGIPVALMAARL